VLALPGVLSDESAVDRGVIMMAATASATVYASLKPLDPVTKKAGVFNLYLHAALAHVRHSLGAAFHSLKRICDESIKLKIAELNRYFRSKINHVSRGQSLSNKEAMAPMLLKEPNGRLNAELLLLTRELAVCPCIVRIGATICEEFKAVMRFACRESTLSVSADTIDAASPTAAALVAKAKSVAVASKHAAKVPAATQVAAQA